MTKLSIIIPTYNSENYILNCLNSIIFDKFTDFEVIIINDGSTDKTKEVVEKISDKRIKLYNNENHGVSYSRNFGLERANGEYIMFVDSDDTIEHNSIDVMMNYILEYKADIVIGQFESKNCDLITFQGNEIKQLIDALIVPNKNELDSSLLGYSWGKIYSKKVLRNIYFDTKLHFKEDTLFNLNIYNNSKKIIIIPKKCYNYVLNNDSTSFKYFEDYNLEVTYYLSIMKNFVESNVISIDDFYTFGAYMYMNLLKHNILHQQNKNRYNIDLKKTFELSQWCKIFSNVNPKLLDKKYKMLKIAFNYKMTVLIRIMFKINELRNLYEKKN
ncbi:glycosyltransferase [Streptococcus thermophilus]|uniref:Glycosyl transferase, group 2 family protein n=1 Tax=Streptococcus thermophilus TaxID=1308 RepID=A0A4Y3UIC9_STRTR|nr:glycosyltransferase family 2 protein [Streptococcus thermophilus]MDI3552139.1 glycosyltransferase [Streptococcus thermophilus]QBR99959.1 glycosyl transferase, group 2 family protein [Streptococcus thermophilus]GEB93259.1 glycosyl transferase [Streptococcus thermophilus]